MTPRFELGYRFPDGFGEVRLGYRFMDSRGSDTVLVGPLGAAAQKARLDVNFIDLDYATREFSLPYKWELRPAVGLRLATSFLDSQANFLNPVTIQDQPFGLAPFTRRTQYESVGSQYLGVHAVLEVGRKLGVSDFTLFGRVEGAGMFGRTHQAFAETFVDSPGFTNIRVSNTIRTDCEIIAEGTGRLQRGRKNCNRFEPSVQYHNRTRAGDEDEVWQTRRSPMWCATSAGPSACDPRSF